MRWRRRRLRKQRKQAQKLAARMRAKAQQIAVEALETGAFV